MVIVPMISQGLLELEALLKKVLQRSKLVQTSGVTTPVLMGADKYAIEEESSGFKRSVIEQVSKWVLHSWSESYRRDYEVLLWRTPLISQTPHPQSLRRLNY